MMQVLELILCSGAGHGQPNKDLHGPWNSWWRRAFWQNCESSNFML